MKTLRMIIWAAALLALAGAVLAYSGLLPLGGTPNRSTGSGSVTGVSLGGDFTLTSHTGDTVSTRDFRGKYLLIYFGYSFCPDVCPLELRKMTEAMNRLEAEGVDVSQVQPLFVSVDPDRDTPAVLSEYVGDFHDRLIGLTGAPERVEGAMDLFRIRAEKADSGNPDYYLVNHTSLIFLMGPDGQLDRFFSSRDTVDTIAKALRDRIEG